MRVKTYVLVHGAFHGAWCWNEVIAILRAKGHTVHAPTLTGLGERSHLMSIGPTLDTFIEDVAQVIRYEELEDVILVGHSFAGSVVSGVADRLRERLRHLVYLDALLIPPGSSSADHAPEGVENYRRRAMSVENQLAVPPPRAEHLGIPDPGKAGTIAAKLTPHPLQPFYDKLNVKDPLGNGVAATYIACSNPYYPATARSRELARSLRGWRYMELSTGHSAMTLVPAELSEILSSI
ncbi:alpha/beta hydrolase family protein [Trinickia symbiotica]|uniref:Alpha/beta hydrolase n=1 Tax=Trinickia symbiotica TaxID=863227 RepID=A0A2N7WL08_9BURK|nr:alpha/beta hydrolase family protein [Trinickia symbiotica]PMS30108.1 alpha/beta hydrolase [Trinickia symbiotica]PPK41102.1 alpha/beta hydrolase family protein [Trinickia symbiotica]